jgi:eukaryotic-like serine/threonine-protein kinase
MNPELEKLFDQAVSLAGTERDEFIARHCPDPALRRELEMLLSSDQGAETFLQGTVLNAASSMLEALTFSPGQRLGRYRVLSVIGRGGMGLVYLAERADGKFEQQVALKVLQNGSGQPLVAEQLQRECRILASLEHSNIARVLDADVTETGLPYFVMEYVDGQPIDRYCDDHKLSARDRLRVFLPVCDAVHVAHQKLIVHRDLKPDNILVTRQGIPKLLDFGIAKVLSEVPVSPQNTATRVMTPEYASPEQARGEPVTTGTDVYSLGGVLYKLLTGKAPHQLAGKSPLEMAHAISDEEVHKPSEFRRELAGDADSILLMALHKEPERRYRSVDQFAADLERLLERKPVLARPDTVWYRTRKYVRRHFLAVGMSAAIVLLLGAFFVLQGIQLRQTRSERDRANRERDRATRITSFMTGMFKMSDPSESRGNSITAREVLDKASKNISQEKGYDPEQQAQMMHVMGTVYYGLGLYKEAEPLLTQALDIRRRVLGQNHPDTVASLAELARVLGMAGRFPEEEKLQRQVVDIRRRTLGPANLDTITAISQLANTLSAEGRIGEADPLAREVVDLQRRGQGPDSPATMDAVKYLALTLTREGKYAEAEALDRQVLDFNRRTKGADHPDVFLSSTRLASVLLHEGRYAEAESLLRESLETSTRVLGPDHPFATTSKSLLAGLMEDTGRYSEAEELLRDVLATRRRVAGSENSSTLNAMYNLGQLLTIEGRCAEGSGLLSETIEAGKRVLGPAHPLVLIAMAELGATLDCEGHNVAAAKVEREALAGLSHTLGPEQPETMESMVNLAAILMHQQRFVEAEELARQAHDIGLRALGAHDPHTAAATYALARVNARQGRADASFSLLQESIDIGLAPNLNRQMDRDPDLRSLHGDTRWSSLLANAKQRVFAVQKTN